MSLEADGVAPATLGPFPYSGNGTEYIIVSGQGVEENREYSARVLAENQFGLASSSDAVTICKCARLRLATVVYVYIC